MDQKCSSRNGVECAGRAFLIRDGSTVITALLMRSSSRRKNHYDVLCATILGLRLAKERPFCSNKLWQACLQEQKRSGCLWWQIGWRARTLRRDGRPDATIVGYLGHFDVLLARLLFPRDTIVLDLLVFAADTARDWGFGRRRLLGLLGALDRLAIACATIVAVDTQEHLDLLPPRQRTKGIVVPAGASEEWFAAGPSGRRRTTGRCGSSSSDCSRRCRERRP